MRRNIARAYDCLQDEHNRIRTACAKILSYREKRLEREFLRADLGDSKHHDGVLLPRGQRRRVLDLDSYGIGRALLKRNGDCFDDAFRALAAVLPR
jgi:hypothetical protein